MLTPDPRFIQAFLRAATLKQCLAWFKHTQDERVRDALKPLLFDETSGSIRIIKDRVLREELMRLAQNNDAFRRFVEVQSIAVAELDRITAEYLEEQMGGL
jgi:hypothetical protein